MAIPFKVTGKTAIITGGGSGINFAFAKILLEKKCNVVIADLSLRPEAAAFYKPYMELTSSPRAVFQKTDVTSWAALEAMFTTAFQAFGSIDILCAGAGIFEPPSSNFWFPPGSPESKDDPRSNTYLTMSINTIHPIRATQLAISHFLNPPPGQQKVSPTNPKRVVICSSIAGQIAAIGTPLYFASKHAINGFVRSLAELDSTLGIRVAAVAPGGVRTPLLVEHEHKKRLVEGNDTLIEPEEVAEGLLRLCEDEDMSGGTVLEIAAKGNSRKVKALNDPGPQGLGHAVSKADVAVKEVYTRLGTEGWGVPKL